MNIIMYRILIETGYYYYIDLGYDPLGFSKNKSAAQKNTLRLQELKNGRLAMIAMVIMQNY